jgi:hypothetical protein
MEAGPYGIDELVREERLAQDAGDVELAEVHCGPGHHDDRNTPSDSLCGNLLLDREPAQPGKPKVEHDQIKCTLLEVVERLNAIPRLDDLEAFQTQCGAPHPPQIDIVVDDQNDARFAHLVSLDAYARYEMQGLNGLDWPFSQLGSRDCKVGSSTDTVRSRLGATAC